MINKKKYLTEAGTMQRIQIGSCEAANGGNFGMTVCGGEGTAVWTRMAEVGKS